MKSPTNLYLELNQFLRLRLHRKVVARVTCGNRQTAAHSWRQQQRFRKKKKKTSLSLLKHLLCSKCVRWSHRYRRSPRLSTAPGGRGTGRAAVRLSLHNKPGFSKEEHRRRYVSHGSSFMVLSDIKCTAWGCVGQSTECLLTCGKTILRSADSWVFFSTLSNRGRTTSCVSIPVGYRKKQKNAVRH